MNDVTIPVAVRAAAAVAFVGAVGLVLLAIAHLGVSLPGLAALGPAGGAVPQAAGGFAVGAVLYAVIGAGLLRARAWAWASGLVVSALAVLSGVMQFRGAASALGIVVAVLLGALLLLPATRRALLGDR